MLSICFLDRATLSTNTRLVRPNSPHRWFEYPATSPDQTIARLQDCEIAITNKVVIDESVLSACPKLRYIGVAATGTNVVDLEASKRRGITVANVTQCGTQSVAEHAFMLILALAKQLKAYQQGIARGDWQTANQFCFFLSPIQTLEGKTLGLIGTGHIAMATAKLAQAFGMQTLFFSPSGRVLADRSNVELNDLLSQSDIISVHCPLTAQSNNLIGAKQLALMKPTALLVNTARGGIVDVEALIEALQENRIAGAGLDVLPEEPPAANSRLMASLELPNLLVTPHVAWASELAMQTLANQLMQKIDDFIAGRWVENLAG